MENDFDVRKYWDERLKHRLDLRGTGHRRFSLEYNQWLYRAQSDCMDELISNHNVQIAGKRVLDVGSGTGFYINYFQRREAGSLFGLDLAQTSVDFLKREYPSGAFRVADISDPTLPFNDSFDIISAISVLYHILNDKHFQQALHNLCSLLAVNGYLFITDSFKTPILPTARHAHMRTYEEYQSILKSHGVKVIEILPIYYFMNRTFIPLVGAWLLSSLRLGGLLYNLDKRLRNLKISNSDGLKLLIAQRLS
ncbi:MAG: class I SAM-dependent methyltransferase [Anaerolineales bacterium]|nr:class I SAM-dependent methyltransferase [Anaerolineales bacterium]